MTVQQTSLEAFQSISDCLGEEQLKVLCCFRSMPNHLFTDEELSIRLNKPINTITPRRGELEKSGYIIRCRQVRVQRGNVIRSVYTWMLK